MVGVGNVLMKDEGAGIRVIEELARRNVLPEEVDLLDGGTAGYDLLSYLKNRRKIIIIDALKIDDCPGSVYRIRPEWLMDKPMGFSLHEVGIMEVIRTLRMLGENPDIEIVGIVPEDISTMEMSLSGPVSRAIVRAADCVIEIINETKQKIGLCPGNAQPEGTVQFV